MRKHDEMIAVQKAPKTDRIKQGDDSMENIALFENTTLVHEKAVEKFGEIIKKKKKKSWEREKVVIFTFIPTAVALILVMLWAGMFDVSTAGTMATKIHLGGFPLVAALCASAAVSLGALLLYVLKHPKPEEPVEEPTTPVFYRYVIGKEGIKVEYGYHTDNISYGDIKKITSNGYSYFIYTSKKKYQVAVNGFGSKTEAFEKFLSARGFSIGIEG